MLNIFFHRYSYKSNCFSELVYNSSVLVLMIDSFKHSQRFCFGFCAFGFEDLLLVYVCVCLCACVCVCVCVCVYVYVCACVCLFPFTVKGFSRLSKTTNVKSEFISKMVYCGNIVVSGTFASASKTTLERTFKLETVQESVN